VTVGALALVLGATGEARATYSIVATDRASRQVGGAGASCVGAVSVRVVYGSVPGVGAVHAQASLGGPGKDGAVARLAMGLAPADIVAAITDPAFDDQAARRQYGIVDLQGRAAGYTGADDGVFAADRQGRVGAFTYAVQGNLLTSGAVIDHAEAGFTAGGCDLADRLMRALEAGAADGEGDRRCTVGGLPADSAFLEVDRDGEPAGGFLRLEVTATAPASPLPRLRGLYDAWRATHACPAPIVDAGTEAGTDAGGCCRGGRAGARPGIVLAALAALLLRRRRRRAAGQTLR